MADSEERSNVDLDALRMKIGLASRMILSPDIHKELFKDAIITTSDNKMFWTRGMEVVEGKYLPNQTVMFADGHGKIIGWYTLNALKQIFSS